MYICINTAISDPPACVCVCAPWLERACVCVSDQARREERRQIDSQKERAASRLSQRLRGLKKKKNRKKERKKKCWVLEGGDSTPIQTEAGRPAGGNALSPSSS